jgi:isopentenyl-diphosphate delta-isomerase
MSRHVARRLIEAGVSGLDVAGAGGTSWPRIESLRATGPLRGVGLALSGWGIPTAVSVLAVADLGVPVVASGGIRSGLDAAKAIALGATLVGVARPMLVAHRTGGREAVLEAVDALIDTLRAVLLLTGSRTVGELRQRPRAITGDLKAWTEAARSEG